MTPADQIVQSFLKGAEEAGFPATVFYSPAEGNSDIRIVGNRPGERIKAGLAWFANMNVQAADALAKSMHENGDFSTGEPRALSDGRPCCICGHVEPYTSLEEDGRKRHEAFASILIDAVKATAGGRALNKAPTVEDRPRIVTS